MKRILITGLHSYTGSTAAEYLSSWPEKYRTERISLRGDSWRSESFRGFDTVLHTAGLAHDNTKSCGRDLYYRVNSELAFETARKALNDGVRQFIFMSSSIIYGKSAPIGKTKIITRETPVNPESVYGDSKFKAEEMLRTLEADGLKVCILRCPMIYGKGCRGNYPVLSKIARRLPVFPKIHNTRSMLYAENFAEFVRLMIENEEKGIFWPQNAEYSDTSEIVRMIAEAHGRKVLMIPFLEFPLKNASKFSGMFNKAFGSLAYDMALSEYKEPYRLKDLRGSIEETERG
ncbi:MAG: NAD-dependent epimerase/dehydratase family protein [Synergistaceae bacterium]|nr:NAD-dependent epimerase/dehydratase family protein [Synergistaceae bacterium]